MTEFKIQTEEFAEIFIERSTVFDEIFINDSYECIRFPVGKIDEVVSVLLKLKEEK